MFPRGLVHKHHSMRDGTIIFVGKLEVVLKDSQISGLKEKRERQEKRESGREEKREIYRKKEE